MREKVDFSSRQRRFIEWMATPRKSRTPRTQIKIAEEIGVNAYTLTRWSKLPEVKEAIIARARELVGDALVEIYASLTSEAISGSFQHIKLVLELTNEYVQKSELDLDAKVSGLPDEYIAALERGHAKEADPETD